MAPFSLPSITNFAGIIQGHYALDTHEAAWEEIIGRVRPHAIFAREKQKRLGEEVEVVVTQVSKHDGEEMLARSEHNEMIAFPSDLRPGSSAMVRLTGLKGNTYTASVVQ